VPVIARRRREPTRRVGDHDNAASTGARARDATEIQTTPPRPSETQSFHKDSAARPPAPSTWVRSPLAPQNQGRNWKLPSSVPIAENVMPFFPADLTFFSATVSDAQSLTDAGSTWAAARTFLL
jgi:hypothetical protein